MCVGKLGHLSEDDGLSLPACYYVSKYCITVDLPFGTHFGETTAIRECRMQNGGDPISASVC